VIHTITRLAKAALKNQQIKELNRKREVEKKYNIQNRKLKKTKIFREKEDV